MEPFTRFESVVAVLPQENIDTDQIIPARFLTTTQRAGIGQGCFADWRFDAQGNERPDFPLHRPELRGAGIAFGTLVERTTRFTMLLHLPRMEGHGTGKSVKNGPALAGHGAEAVRDAIAGTISGLPAQLRRS